jgi:hypothetical protein
MSFWVLFRFRGKESALVRHDQILPVEELQELERTARRVATLMPEILLTNPKRLCHRLKLQNQQKKKPTSIRSH